MHGWSFCVQISICSFFFKSIFIYLWVSKLPQLLQTTRCSMAMGDRVYRWRYSTRISRLSHKKHKLSTLAILVSLTTAQLTNQEQVLGSRSSQNVQDAVEKLGVHVPPLPKLNRPKPSPPLYINPHPPQFLVRIPIRLSLFYSSPSPKP